MATGAATRRLLQSVFQSWMNFDLAKLQKELDITAADLADRQDKSEASRKKLVELSREFKKSASEDVMKSVIPLLKSFQGEIDALLKRSKLSEAAFLSVYQKLINLPDPVLLLRSIHWEDSVPCVETTSESEACLTHEENDSSVVSDLQQLELLKMNIKSLIKKSDKRLTEEQVKPFGNDDELENGYDDGKDHRLPDGYALLAERLREAECHVMALRTALDSTKAELEDMSNKYEAAVQINRVEHLDKRSEKCETAALDAAHILQIIEDRLKDRPDFDEIRSVVCDALSFSLKPKSVENVSGSLTSNARSCCGSCDAESESETGVVSRCSRQQSASEGGKDGNCHPEYSLSQGPASMSLLETISHMQALEQCKHQAKNHVETSALASSSCSLDLPIDSGHRFLLSGSCFRPKVSSPRNHLQSPQGSLSQVTVALGQGGLDTLPETMKLAKTESLGIHSLDTADVAQRIREILSTHNIGQRLFARHVLGLSQGTVSELLSKPKHWDKLTEKGRESYRRMHLWASDDGNIMALKAYAPKKGSNVVLSNYEQDDAATEERIAQILSEAQAAMRLKQSETKGEAASTMVANIYQQELAKLSQSEPDTSNALSALEKPTYKGGNRQLGRSMGNGEIARGRKPLTDGENLTQDIVARIYQEELLKLASAAEASGNIDELNIYRQELERLSLSAELRTNSLDRKAQNVCDSNDFNHPSVKSEELYYEGHNTEDETASSERETSSASEFPQDLRVKKDASGPVLLRHSGSAFTLVRPRSTRQESESPKYVSTQTSTSSDVSPLQQMQSIANSLLTKSQRPLRAILPPITQEQINKYSNINTDELVRKVKEMLSQYSISQRLFGENVLGLSQGSVSDLLARPKPWYMLTQKGREPFIRMQIFLEDEEAIAKLVVTQFQIPPEKFLRCNSVFSDSMTPGFPMESSVPPTTPLSSSSPLLATVASSSLGTTNCCSSLISRNLRPSSGSPPTGGVLPGASADSQNTHKVTNHSVDTFLDHSPVKSEPLLRGSLDHGSLGIHSIPGVREPVPLDIRSAMAMILPAAFSFAPAYLHPSMLLGLQQQQYQHQSPTDLPPPSPGFDVGSMIPQDLDTLEITTKVKEVLQFHNLGQKLFGEAVLGLSQGSVSELLSKPKPWHLLSLKGREPFFKMHMWLMDPLSIERLKKFQDQLKAHKRKASSEDQPNDSQLSHKKPRVFFTKDQKMSLHRAYVADPYPNQSTLDQLARDLAVGTKTVINWFHNHRMRAKHQQGLSEPSLTCGNSPSGSNNTLYTSKTDINDEMSNMSDDDVGSSVSETEQLSKSQSSAHDTGSNQEFGSSHDNGSDVINPSNCLFPSFETASCSRLSFGPSGNMGSSDSLGDFAAVVSTNGSSPLSGVKSNTKLLLPGAKPQPDCHEAPDPLKPAPVSVMTTKEKEKQCINKRKSAKPQWVFEGTVLDRSKKHCSLKTDCDPGAECPIQTSTEACHKEVESSAVDGGIVQLAETNACLAVGSMCNGKS